MSFPTTPILDDFNRANGPLGVNWGSPIYTGDDAGVVVGNQYGAGSAWGDGYWSVETFDDCEVYATATNQTQDTSLVLRLSNAGNPDCYEMRFLTDGSIDLYRIAGGSVTQATSIAAAGTWAAGDQLGASAIGDTLTAYVNGVAEGSHTDATWSSGYIGLDFATSGTTQRLENFGGGAPVVAPAVPSSPATLVRASIKAIIDAEFTDLALVGGCLNDRLHPAVATDGNYAAVFPSYEEEQGGQVQVQDTWVTVQLFGQWDKQIDPNQVVDPTRVEGWSNRLKRAINNANPAAVQMVWYFRVTRVEYPPDPTGNITRLVATVKAYGNNPSTTETAP